MWRCGREQVEMGGINTEEVIGEWRTDEQVGGNQVSETGQGEPETETAMHQKQKLK